MKYDAIIIGNGQASSPLAKDLMEAGQKVALIEREHYGGVCMNTGCTPTKVYVETAKKIFDAKRGNEYGFSVDGKVSVSLSKIKERKDKIVNDSRDNIKDFLFGDNKLTVYDGHATFLDSKTVEVNGEKLTSEKIFINTGTQPMIPKALEHIDYLTNETILNLEDLPEHLIVMGGGYIGLEFGQMFSRFGSKVTIVETHNQIAGKEDVDISDEIESILEAEGITIRKNAQEIKAEQKEGKIFITLSPDRFAKPVVGLHLLICTGRKPNTEKLGLENIGVRVDKKGYIKVDDFCQTNVEGIWALGDCNGEGAFTHTAYNDYKIVSDKLLGSGRWKISDRHTTYAMFIDPPLGRVGMTEKQAQDLVDKGKLKAKVVTQPMSKVARAIEKGETKGLIKLIVEENSEKILGATFLGIAGDEVVQTITAIMNGEGTTKSIEDSLFIHPTVHEKLPTMLKHFRSIEKKN